MPDKTPNGHFAYVLNSKDDNILVIDTATKSVVATIPVGSGPVQVAFTPNGQYAYVLNSKSNNVSVIDTATKSVVATIPVGDNPTPWP